MSLPEPIPVARYVRTTASGSGGKVTYLPPDWRFGELLIGLGTDQEVADKLVRRGYARVPRNSIVGWRLRNSIPPFWIPIIIQMGLDEGVIKDIPSLLISKKPKKEKRHANRPVRHYGPKP